ncbi:MAG: 16S rRNA processing protein RimM [Phototrophicales bacterium]|nr:MAG: 16S rRNA processing protein RimM [Phototrophicales bacterium]
MQCAHCCAPCQPDAENVSCSKFSKMPDNHPDSSQRYQPDYLLLGEILRPHGVRGELRIRILTDYPERIAKLKTIFIGDSPTAKGIQPYTVENMRMNKGYGLLKLKEISDRNEAERFRKLFVMVALEDAVPLEEGEFYLYQLIGLAVQTTDGRSLGHITDVIETGANDVYVVNGSQYGEILIPAIESTIIETNIDAGILTVRLLEGQLPNDLKR